MKNWKKSVSQRIRHLSSEQACEYLSRIQQTGLTVDQAAIRELTDGYASQSINAYVVRKLAGKVGLIKKDYV
jgi:hypothetical protein